MAYKEVLRVEVQEVVRRWQAGSSQRQIAEGTGLSRATVRKYVSAATVVGVLRDGPAPDEEQLSRLAGISRAGPRQVETPVEDSLEPWADQIYQWLTGNRLRVTRIQELLEARGCTVSYTSLRRFIRKRNWGRRSVRTVRMADTEAREVAEADFGRLGMITDPTTGRRRVVWALIIVLSYSRHCFVWPMYSQKLEDVIAGLEAAWAFFGGVPRYLVIDNFPAAVAGADPLHPRLTRGFLEYSQHRGFVADPARARHSKDKPKVERSVSYVRERFFKGGDFSGVAHLRVEAQRWCLEVAGMRIHGTTCRQPLVVFRRSVPRCCPGTVILMRSPTGAPPRYIPTITWPASTPSIRCQRPSVHRVIRWRSGWTANWCASTTGANWSRSMSDNRGAAAPPIPTTTQLSSLPTP